MLLRIPAPGPRSGASSPCPLLCDERVPPTRLGDFSSLPQLHRYPVAAAQENDIISFTISPTPRWTLGPLAFGAGRRRALLTERRLAPYSAVCAGMRKSPQCR